MIRIRNSIFLRELDRTFAIAGGAISIVLIVLGVATGRCLALLMGLLVLISCIFWLVILNKKSIQSHIYESRPLFTFCAICFFGLYILSILSIYFRQNLYERPLLYFIMTALMAGIIACEILTSKKQRVGLILIQILILGVSIIWSQLLIFPSLIGVDPWYHSALTNLIISEGYIPEIYNYSKLPFFHLMVAITSLITDLPYKFANMVSVSLVQIICNSVFVYLIANFLFKNHRIGMLAALMVIITNHHIMMSLSPIPNGFGAIFIPIVLYLILCNGKNNEYRDKTSIKYAVPIILLSIGIILTHSIVTTFMAILLFVAYGALKFYGVCISKVEYYIPLVAPVGFTMATFFYWTFVSGHLQMLNEMIKLGFSIDYFGKIPAGYSDFATPFPLGEEVFNIFPSYVYFAIGLLGFFYMISKRGNSSMFFIAWVAITPLVIVLISEISGGGLITCRWWYFAQIFMSIPLAVSIYLMGEWKSKRNFSFCAIIFVFIVALSFLMIMSTPANNDNHLFSPVSGSTHSYTQSEMSASNFFALTSTGVISSDFNYCSSPSSSIFSHIYSIENERLLSLDESMIYNKFEHDGSIKILRSKFLHEPIRERSFSIFIRPDLNEYLSNQGFNKIFNNSAVTGYIG